MPYALSDAFTKSFSRVEWKHDVFGLDAFFKISCADRDAGDEAGGSSRAVSRVGSQAEIHAAAYFGGSLLSVINPVLGDTFVHFVLGLLALPTFQSLGSKGVRPAVELIDNQLRVYLSSANAWAHYITDAPNGSDLTLAPSAPAGILNANSAYTAGMVQLALLSAVAAPGSSDALSQHRDSRSSGSGAVTGPRNRVGKIKCPDFAFTGKCPRGDACSMAHEALSEAEGARWSMSFRRRPHGGRAGAGDKTSRRPKPDAK